MNHINSAFVNLNPKKEYERTVDVIAIALLLQMTLSQLGSSLLLGAQKLFLYMGIENSSVVFGNLSSCTSIIIYCISFLLPAFFILKSVTPPPTYVTNEKKIPKNFIFVTIAALGCVIAAGNITAYVKYLLKHIGVGFYAYPTILPDDILGIALSIISLAVVPAIVEETLFRKAILGSLLPYGKGFAVVVSSAAFSLMHCNPSQFLYTFAGGILFGTLVVKCRSVFPAMLIHFINNFLSIIYLLVDKYAGDKVYEATAFATDTLLMVLGLIALIYLIRRDYFKKDVAEEQIKLSVYKGLLRVFALGYVLYCLYLSARWVYII